MRNWRDMKWLAVAGVLALVLAAPLQSAKADNDVGCGVGTEIWKGETGLVAHLAASFTNGLTFQSISLTFGLLNCDGRDEVTADAQLRKFAAGNIDHLARDMASGDGESLDALAGLLGIAAQDREAFAGLVQSHFVELFPNDQATSGVMLEALDRLLRQDAVLARYARS